MFCKKGVLRNFAKSTENTCSRVSFLKKRLWHGCFPVNFYEIFLTEQLRWLLLKNLFTHSISEKTKGFPLNKSSKNGKDLNTLIILKSCVASLLHFHYCGLVSLSKTLTIHNSLFTVFTWSRLFKRLI